MAAPLKPSKKPVLGKTAYWLVPTIASQAAPTALEINAVGALNITCYLLGEQEGLGAETAKVELARALCETSTTESLDVTKFTLPDFRFLWDPQAIGSATDKKAWTMLKDGFSGYLVRRQNVISATDASVTTAEFVDVAQVAGSIGVPKESGTDAAGLYVFDVTFGVLATPSLNVAVV